MVYSEGGHEEPTELLKLFGVREIKAEAGKSLFILSGKKLFEGSSSGIVIDSPDGSDLGSLGVMIEACVGEKLIFRAVNKESRALDILSVGVDEVGKSAIPGKKEEDEIYATPYLNQATKYGRVARVATEPLEHDVIVAFYSADRMEKIGNNLFRFKGNPDEIIRGVLVLKANSDNK